ncbi:predicted protein [Thalassiosira pseudonana CCMP1335]|uniref:sn-1-specific diacylglycerol lipase n=1 Tax=Thalassiosira pseudonana TaxID=35128 RepID=B8C207_THAPS|nr:predicted protein [Thalassiosira pseudonana CCMP1335]EED91857.1 predicted protein [Thalassiosira pseudonana CCMP1335]
MWRSTPTWLKPRISKNARKFTALFGSSAETSGVKTEDERVDSDDLTDMVAVAAKLQGAMDVAKTKLLTDLDDGATSEDASDVTERSIQQSSNDRGNGKTNEAKDDFNIQASLLALLQLIAQVKSRRANSRDQLYRFSGSSVPNNALTGLDEMFELADLAYDEHLSGKPMKEVLSEMNYDLLKHDTTSVPGYLGHYVAISSNASNEKTAIIGVKGTSNFEDFLTDMCANAVEYNITTNPFYDKSDGNYTLRCHEGVFISSKRLADDVLPLVHLLLASGYNLRVVGHSLGAGCATILALFLRSKIPSLREDGRKLQVWAFASPPILDLESAIACSPFVTTVVNNCDVVPRANVAPLAVTARLLRSVNNRLKERNLDFTNFQTTFAFLNKIREGIDGDMLMSADEVVSELERGIEKVDLKDKDHLYVPGKVVVLYDLWEKEEQKEQKRQQAIEQNLKSSIPVIVPTAEEAILSDGTCKALRYIELDKRMLDDHMAPAYRSSIADIIAIRRAQLETND